LFCQFAVGSNPIYLHSRKTKVQGDFHPAPIRISAAILIAGFAMSCTSLLQRQQLCRATGFPTNSPGVHRVV